MTTIKFESNSYTYLSCYSNSGELISSNYYDDNTIDRGEYANLTVINNSTIIGIYKANDIYYCIQNMRVSNVDMLPPNGIIKLEFYIQQYNKSSVDLSNANVFYMRSPIDIATTINLSITPITKYIPVDNVTSKELILMGNMADIQSAQSIGHYYPNQNIAIDPRLLTSMLNNTQLLEVKKLNNKTKHNNIILIFIIIFIGIIVSIGICIYNNI